MSQASKTDMAYAAAMLDGEGTFSISRIRLVRNGKVVPNQYQYQLRVTISNCSLVLMKWLVDKLGGTYYTQVNHASKKAVANGQKYFTPCYRWNLLGGYKSIELFLLAVLPYLVIKVEQAKVALEFTRNFEKQDVELRDNLWQKMGSLNRGSRPETNTQNIPQYNDFRGTEAMKIESDLCGDIQSEPAVTQDS